MHSNVQDAHTRVSAVYDSMNVTLANVNDLNRRLYDVKGKLADETKNREQLSRLAWLVSLCFDLKTHVCIHVCGMSKWCTHTQNPYFRLKRLDPFWPIVNGMHGLYQSVSLSSTLPDSITHSVVELTGVTLLQRDDQATRLAQYGGADVVTVPEDIQQPADLIMQQLCGEILATVTKALTPGECLAFVKVMWFDVHVIYLSNACSYPLYNIDM